MKQKHLLCAISAMAFSLAATSLAQERGSWRAASTTAKGITGDIAFGNEKISINFVAFTLAQIRPLTPAETSALFHVEPTASGAGNLYRIIVPAGQKFLHHNTLCGAEETDWIITYVEGRTLQMAMFSDPKVPDLTAESLANDSRLCGTYTYVR